MWRLASVSRRLDSHGGSLLLYIVDVSNHVEGTFWEVIVFTTDDCLESLDGVL